MKLFHNFFICGYTVEVKGQRLQHIFRNNNVPCIVTVVFSDSAGLEY